MERLLNMRCLLQGGDYLCQVDLKDRYYCVPFKEKLKEIHSVPLVMKETYMNFFFYVLACPTPQIFTKQMKITIAILRRSNWMTFFYWVSP